MTEHDYVFTKTDGVPIKSWTRGVDVSENAWEQLRDVAQLPFVGPHVAAMPDVHWGIGATVGSVIPTENAVVPAAVGVDIGCGMMATRLDLTADQLPDNLAGLRSEIESRVPHGRTHWRPDLDEGSWTTPPDIVEAVFAEHAAGLKEIVALPSLGGVSGAAARAVNHFGTLGTGNHFVEVCLDKDDVVWVMLHSGSRGIGNAIGTGFIKVAKQEMKRWHIELPNPDLAYLVPSSKWYGLYIRAVKWAQGFAWENRRLMNQAVLDAISVVLGTERGDTKVLDVVHCHHNYIAAEEHFGKKLWITRKGAVRAQKDDRGIIPGSMGARSYIVRGKGNPQSFCSCSHGAGRAMSRGEAKRRYTVADHEAATDGVECRKDADVIDETPMAYKPIDAVMAAQRSLVEVEYELRQIVCVKG